jgi:hypothetical protein
MTKKISMKKIGFLLLPVFVLLYSCSSSNNVKTVDLKKGDYSYVISDSSGLSLVEGVIKMDAIKKDEVTVNYRVSGTYTITKMTEDTSYIGFTSMKGGEFSGFYNDSLKMLSINTNPKIADANVFINAKVTGNEITGGWSFSTFRSGLKEAGLFKAIKIN